MKAAEIAKLVAEGDRLAAQRRYEDAAATYDRALALESHNGAVLFAKGVSLLMFRAYEGYRDALQCFEAARDAGYATALLWYHMGVALMHLKRFKEARDASERAVAMDPNMAEAWNNVAHSLWRLGQDDEALVPVDRALALKNSLVHAWYNKGMALFHLRRYAEALVAFERATALKPSSMWYWLMQAETLYRLRRYPQALAAFEEAIERDPHNQTLWRRKGQTLLKMRRFIGVFKVAVKLADLQEELAVGRESEDTHALP